MKQLDLSAGSPVQLGGAGLVLREWEERDLLAMVEICDDPDVAHWTPLSTPFTLEVAELRLRRAAQPDRLLLAITTDGEQPLGEVLLLATGELGYLVGSAHRGQGLAGRALGVLRDHAHGLGLSMLRLRIEGENAPSARVARAADFVLVESAAEVVESKRRSCVLDVWEHRD